MWQKAYLLRKWNKENKLRKPKEQDEFRTEHDNAQKEAEEMRRKQGIPEKKSSANVCLRERLVKKTTQFGKKKS